MFRVAIGAGGGVAVAGGDGFAMNACLDIFGRLVMASSASLGKPGEVQRRGGRVGREDGVAVVAVAAGGGAFLPGGRREAMNTGAVAFGLLGVALGASGGLRRDIVVRMLGSNVRVAIHAGVGLVDCGLEPGFIDEQRDFFASGVGLGEGFIGMAIEAGAVGILFSGGSGGEQSQTKTAEKEASPGQAPSSGLASDFKTRVANFHGQVCAVWESGV